MKPKTQNKAGSAVLFAFLGVIFTLFAIILFIGDMDFLLGEEPRDLNEIVQETSPTKDTHVKLNSYVVLGNFAETKHYINGIIPSGKEQHYLIMLDNADVIAVTVKNKKIIKKLDDMEDGTIAWVSGTADDLPLSVEIQGKLSTMDSKIEGFFRDYISDLDDAGITDIGMNYYSMSIDTTETRTSGWMLVLFSFVVGVGCIIGMIVTIKQNKKAKQVSYVTATPNMVQPANPYVNPVTGESYDPSTVNPVTDQTYDAAQNPDYENPSGQDGNSYQ